MPDPQYNIYPPPDPPGTGGGGGTASAQMVPSSVPLDAASLVAGAAAVGVAAVGLGASPAASLLLQSSAAAAGGGVLDPQAVPVQYVWWFLGLASLSFLLGTVNLVRGFIWKRRALRASGRICEVPKVQEILAEEAKALHGSTG